MKANNKKIKKTTWKIVAPLLKRLNAKEKITLEQAALIQNSDYSRLKIENGCLLVLSPEELVQFQNK